MPVRHDGNYIFITSDTVALTAEERGKILRACPEDMEEEISGMLAGAEKNAAPKALYRVLPIESKGTDSVTIAGVTVVSALMRKNFDPINRVFPYAATCGTELEHWSLVYKNDILLGYWADEIKKLYLLRMSADLRAHIKQTYGLEDSYSSMNPGSIRQWPITGQKELFAILGKEAVKEKLGITLTDSMLMLPAKSISGIGFESGSSFESCRYCPIPGCPNRRAPADRGISQNE